LNVILYATVRKAVVAHLPVMEEALGQRVARGLGMYKLSTPAFRPCWCRVRRAQDPPRSYRMWERQGCSVAPLAFLLVAGGESACDASCQSAFGKGDQSGCLRLRANLGAV